MKPQSYHTFWQRLHKTAKNKGFPLRVMWELTYRCNFRCSHCYVPQSYRKKGELKTKEVFSILGQLADIGCFYLGFTGGEPFMRKDILDILWYAKRCGFEVIIYTNGSLINESRAKELAHLRPNKVDITLPAMSKDAFERITKIPDSHRRVFKAIEFLKKEGVNLGFKTCLLKENESQIEDIQNFASSLGALHRLDDMLSSRLDGSKEPYRHRGVFKKNLITNYQLPITRRPVTNEGEFKECDLETDDSLFKCGVGVSQAAITPLGELKMCLMIDYPKYKILESSLKDAWTKLKELVENIKPDKNYQCNTCKLEYYCKWCPARAWLYNKNFTFCEPESHRKAELTRQLLNC